MHARQSLPTISILICTRNRGAYLSKLLQDLQQQLDEVLEVIIVFDVSDAINQKRPLSEHRKITYIWTTVGSIPKSRNIALSHAKGEVLLFLDDDVRIDKTFVGRQRRLHKLYPHIDALTGLVLPTGRDGWSEYLARCANQDKIVFQSLRRVFFAITMAFSFKKSVLANTEIRFNENFRTGEDIDFSFQLTRQNKKIFFSPSLIVRHDFLRGSIKNFFSRFYLYGLDTAQLYRKNDLEYLYTLIPKNRLEYFFLPLFIVIKAWSMTRQQIAQWRLPLRCFVPAYLASLVTLCALVYSPQGKIEVAKRLRSKNDTLILFLGSHLGSVQSSVIAGTERMVRADLSFFQKRYSITAHSLSISGWPLIPTRLQQLCVVIAGLMTTSAKIISYSAPFVALFRPRKTIIMLHIFCPFLFPRLLQFRYKRAVYLFCSRALYSQYVNRYPWLRSAHCQVLYNAVGSEFTTRLRSLKNKRKVIFGFCSAWVYEKGLEILLDALELLPDNLSQQYAVHLAGGLSLWSSISTKKDRVQYDTYIKERIATNPCVKLVGMVEYKKMPNFYRSLDWLVVPSRWEEPFGLIALEAISCGTQVVASDKGGLPEILSKNNSRIVHNITAEILAKTLREIIENKHYATGENLLTRKNANMTVAVREAALAKLLL